MNCHWRMVAQLRVRRTVAGCDGCLCSVRVIPAAFGHLPSLPHCAQTSATARLTPFISLLGKRIGLACIAASLREKPSLDGSASVLGLLIELREEYFGI